MAGDKEISGSGKLRIAYLSTFYPYRGGIAQFNASLYRVFGQRAEVKAWTFTRQYPGLLFPGQTQFVQHGDEADPVPAIRILDTINPLTWWKTARAIAEWKPDVLVMKFWMPFFAPSLGVVSGYLKKRGVACVAILDNVIPHEKRPGDLFLIRAFLNRSSAFVAMSKTVEADLLKLHPFARYLLKPHPVYDHFPPPVEKTEAQHKLKLNSGKKYILFFGFIRGYKGLDVLLRALPSIQTDVNLVIAGEVYGSFDSYQQVIDSNGLNSRVHVFTRYIPDWEVALFFSAADVVVLPYKSATQSGIVQIAYRYDLPAIVTDVGGLTEMVEDSVTGLVVKPESENELADAVNRFYTENRLEPFQQEIRRRAASYSWDGFAEAVLLVSGVYQSGM